MTPVSRVPLIVGNWKMNGLRVTLAEIEAIGAGVPDGVDVRIAPPATLIGEAARRADGQPVIGAQDCHTGGFGPHTGDLSALMLADAGARFVIVGHSERRVDHRETDAIVLAKARAGLLAGMDVIVCVGESLAEREAGEAVAVVTRQVEGSVPPEAAPQHLILAYEPIWAIGTGRTPTGGDVAAMHGAIRAAVVRCLGRQGASVRLLYGGSVKPDNARDFLGLAAVDGALVGGASLHHADFLAIVVAAREAARAQAITGVEAAGAA